jgi:hypothetical protein
VASRLVAAFCAVTGAVKAEPPRTARREPLSTVIRPMQYYESSDRARLISDLTQVKNATLESEAAFFDRLAKQKKIEDVRLDARSAASDLRSLRNRLSADELVRLEQVDEVLARVNEPLDDAGKFIAIATTELRRYHDVATAEAREIAAGNLEAAPLVSRIRQVIKSAERSLQTVVLRLPRAQEDMDEGTLVRDGARKLVAKAIEATNQDDPRRPILVDCQKAIDTAIEGLNTANKDVTDLIALLEMTRREYLPECAIPPAPSPAPATNGIKSNGRSAKYGDSCYGASLLILNKSAPAIAQLNQAAVWHSNVTRAIDVAQNERKAAVKYLEMVEALSRPTEDKLRTLQALANELLDKTEDKLLETKRSLVEDAPGETAECTECGGMVFKTRRVVDPACSCVNANAAMLEAEDMIRQAQLLAEQMATSLDELPDQTESRRMREPDGVLYKLTRALERGEEFRNQQFDILPGETIPRIQADMPKRDFPPMVANYVARLTWHYPVYFQDIALERYGHHHGCLQPFVSYGKFLADLAMLPYSVCLEPPCCIQYDLGLYRPGDDVPHLIYLPRPDCKAALFEAAVWTGLMFFP